MSISIREERSGDAAAIEAVTVAAFRHAAHRSGTEHAIVNALRRDNALSVSLVAESDGAVVGHVAVSPVAVSDGSQHWFGLGPISVLPEHQSRGVGSALIDKIAEANSPQQAIDGVLGLCRELAEGVRGARR